jgi:hypothetical protein
VGARAGGLALDVLVALAACLIEAAAVVGMIAGGGRTLWPLLAVHVLMLVLIAVALRHQRRRGHDTTGLALALVATAATGPIGAGLAALAMLLERLSRPERPELLDAWYERIALATEVDPVTALADRVAVGRAADLSAAPPRSFAAIMEQGEIGERQVALGLIARRFHPAYLEALTVALRSAEPVIRVQAAAVAAKLRPELARFVNERRARASKTDLEPAAAAAELADLDRCIRSGLLDAAESLAAETAAEELAARAASGGGRPEGGHDGTAAGRALEDALIRAGRFDELRRRRRIDAAVRRLGGAGTLRVRGLAGKRRPA